MSLNRSHLPLWLQRNPLFRVTFLLRKLYLTRCSARYYAQFAEDVSIARLFDKRYRGFYVDVGCFHPRKYNSTWQLYQRGWRGINIDIDSIKIDGFNLMRPDDVNIASAVSNVEGEIGYYSKGFYSLTTSLDEDFAEAREGYQKNTTRSARLTTLIDGTRYRDQPIDLLSVDVEGHDLEVLTSLDFARYDPKLIAVESRSAHLSELSETALYRFLTEKGYGLVGWCGLTHLMANRSLQESLSMARRARNTRRVASA